MKVYCVRHGEAQSPDVDPERSLTENGRRDIVKIANFLSQNHIEIEHVMHSPKARAKQTAQILAEQVKPHDITECDSILSPEADIQAVLEMIKAWTEDTMIVGHLPFMDKLVAALMTNNEDYYPLVSYSPGTIVCLEYYEDGRWVIKWLMSPSSLADVS